MHSNISEEPALEDLVKIAECKLEKFSKTR